MSRVDVIIPCYKYGHFLGECVRSVLTQEGVQVRVLIIDDASPDQTEQVGTELASSDSRVVFRKHQVNKGHIATYNEGLKWASEDYLLLLSADDVLVPGALCRATCLLDQHPEVGLTHGRVIRTDRPEEGRGAETPHPAWQIVSGENYIRSICKTGENVVATPTAVARTSVQKQVGGYRKELPHAGDMEMWLRFAAYSSVAYTDVCQAYYRMHGANMSDAYKALADFRQRKDTFQVFFQEHGGRVPDAARLLTTALRSLSREALWEASKEFDAQEMSLYRAWLALSLDTDPGIRSTREWKRFRVKRVLGPRVWRTVKPLLGFCQRGLATTGSPTVSR
jgi:hypothetical protein